MCQLCFINLNSRVYNTTFLLHQMQINASVGHEDGCGYYSKTSGLWKTDLAAHIITNLGRIIRNSISDGSPIMSHVRKATFTNNVKTKSSEKSHPFEGEKLVLAHNGHLDLKDTEKPDKEKVKDMIDTEIFLYYLEMEYDGTNFVSALQKTMEKFTGKFAFIIFDKINEKWYIVRGESALLHYIQYMGGIIVNTERMSLINGMRNFVNDLQLLSAKNINVEDFKIENIKEVAKETIFEVVGKELVKVGEVKENKKVYAAASTWNEDRNWYNGWGTNNNNRNFATATGGSVQEKIESFLSDFEISVFYLDNIIYCLLGAGLLECTANDLNCLVNDVIPFIRSRTKKHIIKEWRRLKNDNAKLSDIELNLKTGLNFPYMFNTVSEIRTARASINITKKDLTV